MLTEKQKHTIVVCTVCAFLILEVCGIVYVYKKYNSVIQEKEQYKIERDIYKLREDTLINAYKELEIKEWTSDREREKSQASYDSLKNVLKQKDIIYVTKNLPILHFSPVQLDSFWANQRGHANN